MAKIATSINGHSHTRETHTLRADQMDEFLEKRTRELAETNEWVDVSDSMPILWYDNYLHYTVTITYGDLV